MGIVDDIREWLEGVLEQGAERLELRLRNDDARVRGWLLSGKAVNDSSNEAPAPAKLAEEIAKAAERDGKGHTGATVTYAVFAYRGGEDERHLDRLFVEVSGRGKTAGRGGDEDVPANQFGMMQQILRQNAELHRLLIMSQEGRQDANDRMIAKLLERNDQHESKRALVLDTWEKVASLKMEQQHHELQMKLEEQRQKFLVDKLDMLAPVVLNRALGGGSGKGTPYFGEEIVRQLLGKMKPHQIDGLMRNQPVQWDPEQIMLFGELYVAYAEREKQKKRAEGDAPGDEARAGSSSGVGIPDANGKGQPS